MSNATRRPWRYSRRPVCVSHRDDSPGPRAPAGVPAASVVVVR